MPASVASRVPSNPQTGACCKTPSDPLPPPPRPAHSLQDRAKHEEAKHGRMERHSGSGRTDSLKRQGSGKGNWGSVEDQIREAVDDL